MSHYAISRIRIKPVPELLERVLSRLARELGATLEKNAIVEGWRFRREVDYLLKKELPYGNGYGIEITDSGITVHVDEHGAPLTAQELAQKIHQYYVTEALVDSLRELGYSVDTREQGEEVIVVAEGW